MLFYTQSPTLEALCLLETYSGMVQPAVIATRNSGR